MRDILDMNFRILLILGNLVFIIEYIGQWKIISV